jgi:hypothetical protein
VAPWYPLAAIYQPRHWLYLPVVAIGTFGLREKNWLYNEIEGYAIAYSPLLAASVIFVSLLFISLSTTFIYFRF